MLLPPVRARVVWRSTAPEDVPLRSRVEQEVERLAWTLGEMEALVHDAHRMTSLDQGWLLPRMELRLPLYDLGRRFRIVVSFVDQPRLMLHDEEGRRVAEIRLV